MPVIYDPANPGPIFDGHIDVYTTCQSCGEQMKVINTDDRIHPTCTPLPETRMESLLRGYISCVEADDRESARLTRAEINKLAAEPPDLMGAAVRYAEWGWPIFPLKAGCGVQACRYCTWGNPCGKTPAIPKAKGGNGFKDATNNAERIGKWWARHPDHNIGVATGHTFDVIDIDPKSGGVHSFMELLAQQANCSPKNRIGPVHAVAVTASGGKHLYVLATGKGNFAGKHRVNDSPEKMEDDGLFGTKRVELPAGIDYRGRGGYVVAPPSTLGAVAREYSWLVEPSPRLKGAC